MCGESQQVRQVFRRVCIIHFPSTSHESSPLTCSRACLSVAACYRPSMWAGIRSDGLGLELICSSTCEIRTRGEKEQAEGPHHTSIRLPPDTLWRRWHTHARTHTRTQTCVALDPPCSRFSFPEKAKHNTQPCGTKIREPLEVPNTSGRNVEFFERVRHTTDPENCGSKSYTML